MNKKHRILSLLKSIALVCSIFVLLRIGLNFYGETSKSISITKIKARISSENLTTNEEPDVNNPSLIIDGLVNNQYRLKTSHNNPSQLILYLANPSSFTNIEFFFPVKPPKTFLVETSNLNQIGWASFLKVNGNQSSTLDITTQPVSAVHQVSAIRITFFESSSADGQIVLGEIRINDKKPSSFLGQIFDRLFVVRREPVSYVFYLALIVLFTLSIGYGFENRQNIKLTPLSLAKAWGKGIAIISLLGLINVTLFPEVNIKYVLIILVTICIIQNLRLRVKLPKATIFVSLIVLVYFINSLFFFYFRDQYDVNAISTLDQNYDYSSYYPTPYGAYETDFMLPYGVTKIWNNTLNHNSSQASQMMAGYQISDRTPLLSLYLIPFLNLFGDRFFIFEMVSVAILPIFLIGAWLLLEKTFNRKVAYLATMLLSFNHWLFFAGNFAQVRLLALFFISMFMYYSIRNKELQSKKNSLYASFFASMAFLSHPFALVYIFPIAIYHLIHLFRHPKKEKFINIIWIYLLPLVTFVFWLIWAKSIPGNSLLISSMTSGNWENTTASMSSTSGLHTGNILDIVRAKTDNFLGIFLANPKESVIRTWGPLRTTFPTALGLFLLPFILISLVLIRAKKNKYILLYSLFIVFLTTFIFLSFYAILGLNWYHLGLIPLFIGIGVIFIRKMSLWFQILILISTLIEYYYINWIYYPHEAGNSFQRFLEIHPIMLPIIIFILIIEVVILSFWTARSNKD